MREKIRTERIWYAREAVNHAEAVVQHLVGHCGDWEGQVWVHLVSLPKKIPGKGEVKANPV